MTLPETPSTDPVNLVIRRRVRRGHEAAYEALISEGLGLLNAIPGHRGTGVIRPAHGEAEYTLISRFDSFRSAADWELSPQRAEWLARGVGRGRYWSGGCDVFSRVTSVVPRWSRRNW